MRTIPIRALIFKDSGRWYAQCLEFDICVQAASRFELIPELADLLLTYVESARQDGRRPFEGVPKAPQQFFDMYEEHSIEWGDSDIPIIEADDSPKIVPTLRIFQAELA